MQQLHQKNFNLLCSTSLSQPDPLFDITEQLNKENTTVSYQSGNEKKITISEKNNTLTIQYACKRNMRTNFQDQRIDASPCTKNSKESPLTPFQTCLISLIKKAVAPDLSKTDHTSKVLNLLPITELINGTQSTEFVSNKGTQNGAKWSEVSLTDRQGNTLNIKLSHKG